MSSNTTAVGPVVDLVVDIVDVENQKGEEIQKISSAPAPKWKWYQTSKRLNRVLYDSSAFLYNLSAYFFVCVLSLRCIELGAKSFELGIVNGILALAGTFGCFGFGFISDKIPIAIVSRAGSLLFLVATILLMYAKNLPLTYVASVLGGLGESAFWPSVDGAIGKEAEKGHEDSSAAIYNTMMALGKTLGCIAAGFIFPVIGNFNSLLLVIVGCSIVTIILPLGSRAKESLKTKSVNGVSGTFVELPDRSSIDSNSPRASIDITPRPSMDESRPSLDRSPRPSVDHRAAALFPVGASEVVITDETIKSRLYLPLALIANCILYGVAGVMASLSPEFFMKKGITIGKFSESSQLYGLTMGILWGMQCLSFAILSSPKIKWQYHRWVLYLFQIGGIGGIFLMSFVRSGWQALLLAAVIGSCVGITSMSSLAYSLRSSQESKGAMAGLHEALGQLGGSVIPISAGFLVSGTTENRSSFWLCAGLILVSIYAEELVFRDRRRNAQQQHLQLQR